MVALAPMLLAAGAAPSDQSGQDEPAGMTPWTVEPAPTGGQGGGEQGGQDQGQQNGTQNQASPAPQPGPAPAAQPSPPPPASPSSQPANAQPVGPTDDQLAQELMGRWGQNPSCMDFFVEFRPDGLALMFETHGKRKSADWGNFSITDGELTIDHITGAITHTHIRFDGDALVGQQVKRRPSRLVRCADQH
jgi:hypothetical protein